MAFEIKCRHVTPDYTLTTLSDATITDPNNGFAHTVTVGSKEPFDSLDPAVSILVPGPADLVSADVDGIWVDGSSITYGFTGPSIGTFGGSVANNTGDVLGPEEMASLAAGQLAAKHGDVINVAAVGNVIYVEAVDGTDVTWTSWTL